MKHKKSHPLQTYYSRIYKTYDLVNRLFTFGLDKKWRNYTVSECLSLKPLNILDLCCGTGDLAILLGKNGGPHLHITGFDLNQEMLGVAREKASAENININFIQGDAGAMPFGNGHFDAVTIGFGFRNLTWENPGRDKYIREMSRIMKSGARLYILESARPNNLFIGFFYSIYLKFILVPLGGLLSGDWSAYRYLAGSSAHFYTFDELHQILQNFQLDLHLKRKFLFGSANLLIATKNAL